MRGPIVPKAVPLPVLSVAVIPIVRVWVVTEMVPPVVWIAVTAPPAPVFGFRLGWL